MTALRQATYSPAVFNVTNMDQAKRIILTKEGELTTEQRWERETPYLLSLIRDTIPLSADSVVLDYGCGIGRMAKALIDDVGCRVVGVDISASMRALACSYVNSDRFVVCAPEALTFLGVECDAVLAIWVLQHCFIVTQDIALMANSLKSNGRVFVVNDHRRIVPTREAMWVNDGVDVRAVLKDGFDEAAFGNLDPDVMGAPIADASYWATFRVRG